VEAEKYFDAAIHASKELKLESLEEKFKKRKLEFQGRHEEARNPYFWHDTPRT
jgi:hypothetical protein